MTADELRELAQKIEEKWWRWKDSPTIELKAAAYLRACADALDAGPVAWIKTARGGARRLDWNEQTHYADADYPVAVEPLYPVAMPGALRLPELMTDERVRSIIDDHFCHDTTTLELIRAVEADVIRRVKKANK